MATNLSFVEYVHEQADLGPRLTHRKMFGEFGLYVDGKVVAFACDDSLFVKATAAVAQLQLELPQAPPYPGAKPYPVADELLDEPDILRRLLLATAALVPEPKPKAPRKKKPAGS
jgi:TfoX/Sxy family transcriptional regulator of competence genes